MTQSPDDRPDNAGIKVPPPLVFLVALLVGLWWDSPWFSGAATGIVPTTIGALITIAGMALTLAGALAHRRAGTSVEPWHPTTAVVTTGVYGLSRNPIYLGMALGQAGIAIAGASIGALVMLVPAVLFIQFYVIAREERYLEAKFGTEYEDYRARVRRWL